MKQNTGLTRRQYLTRFSRTARWLLGTADAAEAISDYRELVFQEGRDESKLVEELGDPVQAAWLLTDAREYKRWQRALAILVCCVLFCAGWAYNGLPFYWQVVPYFGAPWETFIQFLLPVAAAEFLTVCWFRRKKEDTGPMTWRLLLALAAAALVGGIVMLQAWRVFDMTWYVPIPGKQDHFQSSPEFGAVRMLFLYTGFLAPLAGVAGLYLARCHDRRWAAFFLLCLTVSVLCIISQEIIGRTNGHDWDSGMMQMMRRKLFYWLLPTTGAGVIGAGVVLK